MIRERQNRDIHARRRRRTAHRGVSIDDAFANAFDVARHKARAEVLLKLFRNHVALVRVLASRDVSLGQSSRQGKAKQTLIRLEQRPVVGEQMTRIVDHA